MLESKMPKLESLIEKLDVDSAEKFMEGKPVEELRNMLLEYAFDTKDIRVYTLMVELLSRSKKWQWHYLASLILCQPLCSLKGAYFAAYHHALEASRLSPSDASLKEYLLFFNGVPDKPMDDAMAKSVAEDLVRLGSSNELAKRIASG